MDRGLSQLNAKNFLRGTHSVTQPLPPMHKTNSSKKVGDSQLQKYKEDKEAVATTSSEQKGMWPEQIGPSNLRGYQNTLLCNSTTKFYNQQFCNLMKSFKHRQPHM